METEDDYKTRRDALARSLCARICDERRSLAVLTAFDQMLTRLDDPLPGLLELLERDRFALESPNVDRRAGFNAGMEHALALVRAHRGLTELRRSAFWPEEEQP